MRSVLFRTAAAAVATFVTAALGVGPALAVDPPPPVAGDPTMTLVVGDDVGGEHTITFVKTYGGTTADGTPVYVYAPQGWDRPDGGVGVLGIDPNVDENPDATACGGDIADYRLNQADMTTLGNELRDRIVRVDEEHFGPIGDANGAEPGGDALVTLVYNIFDDSYYDCTLDQYTAGYYAPDFKADYGMNVIVIDNLNFDENTGSPETATDLTNEGVIAHELQHLVHDYADPDEISWVNEGLADFAIFLNGYPSGGSHVTYQQVFHRETSLTRWAGGLENYGASYTFFQYLWEQAGGNGVGSADQFTPDLTYSGVAGDLLIKKIFEASGNGMTGVNQAIDAYNAAVAGTSTSRQVASAGQLFRQWSLAVYLDDEHTSLYDLKALDLGGVDSQGWTIDLANDEFFKNRGTYNGSTPEGRFAHSPHVPPQSALPFGTSYETFRNPGKTFRLDFSGAAGTRVISEPGKFWYGGTDSQSDKVLSVTDPAVAGQTVSFDSWYFIENGWDFGFVEAQVGGSWVTLPVRDAGGTVVSTDDDPHGNNTEGNGLTGTSGGTYFVDEPALQRLSVDVPAGATGLRFRYSTDAAYVDTGWFIRDVSVGSTPATVVSNDWSFVDPQQDNNWSVQVVSPCDLTPGSASAGESVDETGRHVYAFSGPSISQPFTQCSTQASFTVVISNLTSGPVDVLDAPYEFRITNTAAKGQKS
jgi:hypothetical protein